MKDPKNPALWEESTSVYAHAIGEIRRISVARSERGLSVVTAELRLIESEEVTLLRSLLAARSVRP